MRIEPETGVVHLPDFSIEPSLRRTDLESGALRDALTPLVDNPPWMSYSLRGGVAEGARVLVALYFEGENLRSIDVVITDEPEGASWDDWSIEKEAATKERHDALCREWLGSPSEQLRSSEARISDSLRFDLPWGKVWSGYDSRSGASSIVIRYGLEA